MSQKAITRADTQPFTITLVEIKDAKFSINPCSARQSTVLSVTAVETVKVLQPQYFYSGDLHSGEV